MKSKFAKKVCFTSAAVLLALSGTASADLISSGGGSYTIVPLYRALSFGTINFGGANGAINGIDYISNTAPLPVANGSTSIALNGATFTGVGQSAYSGFYAGRNYASISVSNANASDAYYEVAGQGSATSVQFFTPLAAAYATFRWRAGGTESNPGGIPPTLNGGVGPVTGRLDFGASINPSVTWLDLFEEDLNSPSSGGNLNSIRQFGAGTFTYTLPIASLGTVINLFYWSSAFAEVDAGQTGLSNYSLTANYYNTFELEDVQLYDASNAPVSEWSLYDFSEGKDVFNQDGRVDPIAIAPPLPGDVPEPATLALLGLGLIGLRLSRRRQ